jgi:hypothetical protein
LDGSARQTSEVLKNIVRDKNKGQVAQCPEFQIEPPFTFYSFENVVVRNQQDENSYKNEQDKKNVFGGANRQAAQPFEIENIL